MARPVWGSCRARQTEKLEEWVNSRVALTKQPRAPWQKTILWTIDQHLFNIALYFLIIANTGVVIADLANAGDILYVEVVMFRTAPHRMYRK